MNGREVFFNGLSSKCCTGLWRTWQLIIDSGTNAALCLLLLRFTMDGTDLFLGSKDLQARDLAEQCAFMELLLLSRNSYCKQ